MWLWLAKRYCRIATIAQSRCKLHQLEAELARAQLSPISIHDASPTTPVALLRTTRYDVMEALRGNDWDASSAAMKESSGRVDWTTAGVPNGPCGR